MDIFKTNIFRYINGDMLSAGPVMMTIRAVELEKVTGGESAEEKPVIYFEKSKKPLVLNAVNSRKLAAALDRETDLWRGAKIELYCKEVKAFGQTHNAVRIGKIEKPAQLTKAQRSQRRADNAALLHGPQDDQAIGDEIKPLDLYAPGTDDKGTV